MLLLFRVHLCIHALFEWCCASHVKKERSFVSDMTPESVCMNRGHAARETSSR